MQTLPDAGTWQQRAIVFTRGNQTMTGACLIAALTDHKKPDNPPKFLAAPMICEHGEVRATFQRRDGQIILGEVIAPNIDVFTGIFRRLADKMKLSDQERTEMFDVLRKWISRDLRENPTPIF